MPLFKTTVLLLTLCFFGTAEAQMVTGVWKGRVGGRKAEVKIVQNGDSLTGTSYYEIAGGFRRYSIKGYFEPEGSVVWWDDQLIESRGVGGKAQQLSVADFNCPGGGEMYLNGKSAPADDPDNPKGDVNLTKVPGTSHPDEWDYVIDNYTVGANDPELIDSISLVSLRRPSRPVPRPRPAEPRSQPVPEPSKPVVIAKAPAPRPDVKPLPPPAPPLTIEDKFIQRKKAFTTEIPLSGDSIELRFYDNAEVDGDSISLFLNNRLLFTHVRLTDRPYTIKLPVADLADSSELVMVAENLGAIPPNTSYMVALVGPDRYTAQLASTENSSAMIRLRKK